MELVEPPDHLSEAARAHLLNPPQVPVVDLSDLEAVRAFREAVHAEWIGLNDDLTGTWLTRPAVIAGVDVVWFAADESHFDNQEVLLHLHGGAYFLGSPLTNASLVVPIAQRTGLPVVSVDYRLAPEHKCPAAVEDATAVATELMAERRIVAMYGESAGGGLALSTAVALRDAGTPLPDRLGVMSPWVDLTLSGDTYRTLVSVDPDFSDPNEPAQWARAYAGDNSADPQASPLFADLAGLPTTLIQVGTREILLSDSCRLDAALRAAGVASKLDIWDGMWHVWQLYGHLPEAQTALDEFAAFLTNS